METALVALVAAYGGVLALLFAFQRRFLYDPDKSVPDLAASSVAGSMRAVRLATADGLDLLAWHARPREGRPTIAYFHGNAGHIGHRADKVRRFLGEGFGLLLVEYRGYGGNPGKPTELGLYADARAGLEFLDREGHGDIVYYGESLGTAVAVRMAVERRPAAVVLESPPSAIWARAQEVYFYAPVRLLLIDRFDSIAKIGRVEAPVLILHGERDTIVPVRHGKALYAAAREPKRLKLYENGGHANLELVGGMEEAIAFVREHRPYSA